MLEGCGFGEDLLVSALRFGAFGIVNRWQLDLFCSDEKVLRFRDRERGARK